MRAAGADEIGDDNLKQDVGERLAECLTGGRCL